MPRYDVRRGRWIYCAIALERERNRNSSRVEVEDDKKVTTTKEVKGAADKWGIESGKTECRAREKRASESGRHESRVSDKD